MSVIKPQAERIMIVDDDEAVNDCITWICVDEGHEIATAHDGQGVVGRLRSGNFRVLITDLRMPHIDGMKLIEEVRSAQLEVGVIVISAYLDDKSRARLADLDVEHVFEKPVSKQDLVGAIRQLLAA